MTAKELKEKIIKKWGYEFTGPDNGNFKPAFTALKSDIDKLAKQLCKEQRQICFKNSKEGDAILNAPMPEI